jgi:hypothetical protein
VNVWAPSLCSASTKRIGRFACQNSNIGKRFSHKNQWQRRFVKIESLKVASLSIKSNDPGMFSWPDLTPQKMLMFSINGSGDIDASQLSFKSISAQVNGSGDIDVWATNEIQAKIVGSGDIEIKGNPKIDAKVVGSGSIKKK